VFVWWCAVTARATTPTSSTNPGNTTVASPTLFQRAVALLAAFRARPSMRTAPSADRNKEPIAQVLAKYAPFSLSECKSCLEIASGTGQHVAFFAARFSHVTFQPTEYAGGSAGPESPAYGSLKPVFDSIVAHSGGMANVLPPCELDAAATEWTVENMQPPGTRWDAVYACNVCHISPFSVSEGLFAGAGRLLAPDGALFIYGPFMVEGQHTAPSNEAFDQRLREQNPSWGVRDTATLAELAANHGMTMEAREEMPANNFVLVFRKGAGRGSAQ